MFWCLFLLLMEKFLLSLTWSAPALIKYIFPSSWDFCGIRNREETFPHCLKTAVLPPLRNLTPETCLLCSTSESTDP